MDKIRENMHKKPKRICFNSTHSRACKKISIEGNSAVGCINLPFDESIKFFIEKETGLRVKKTYNGEFWCPANSEEEYQNLEQFVKKYKQTVFLRDTLDISVAISEYMLNDSERTEIGELEYKAKYENCQTSINQISDEVVNLIRKASVFEDAQLICAIPSSKEGELSLPQKIVQKICNEISKKNISECVKWGNPKSELKELDVSKKLETLEAADLVVKHIEEIKGKNIIIVDDLYQSGMTMQYVAMKLKERGANKIYGISIVKSRKDTDNND